jgi:hypothetical protein
MVGTDRVWPGELREQSNSREALAESWLVNRRRPMHRRIPQVAFSLALLTLCSLVLAAAREPERRSNLIGTWRLVSMKYGDAQSRPAPADVIHLKHVTRTHFTVVSYNAQSKEVTRVGGGSYSLQGKSYTEKVDYALGTSFVNLLGKEQSFTWELQGDRWIHSGTLSSGLKIEEVWERVNEPSPSQRVE